MLQDIRFGFRMLRRTPGFAALALACLTLGIGANAAVFTWIEGILLRPYPLVADQDRLYAMTGTDRGSGERTGLIGCVLALALTRLLGYLLYQVSPRDPAVFASAAFALTVTAAVACLVPALRATRIDPVRTLRG